MAQATEDGVAQPQLASQRRGGVHDDAHPLGRAHERKRAQLSAVLALSLVAAAKGSKLRDGDARLQRRHGDLLVLGSEVGTARANAAGRSLRSRTDQSQIKIVVPARAGAKMSDRHVRTQAAPTHATIWALWIVAAVGSG